MHGDQLTYLPLAFIGLLILLVIVPALLMSK